MGDPVFGGEGMKFEVGFSAVMILLAPHCGGILGRGGRGGGGGQFKLDQGQKRNPTVLLFTPSDSWNAIRHQDPTAWIKGRGCRFRGMLACGG